MLYFAYGSNMSLPRLHQRVPSARRLRQAALIGHELAFHKVGRDGSGKCDIVATGRDDVVVNGVLYEIDADHRGALDDAEGLGDGYEIKLVNVFSATISCRAFTYFATAIDPVLRPYTWYLQHVLNGARENRLPADYIARIAAVPAIVDPDHRRAAAERAIHKRPTRTGQQDRDPL